MMNWPSEGDEKSQVDGKTCKINEKGKNKVFQNRDSLVWPDYIACQAMSNSNIAKDLGRDSVSHVHG